MGRLPCNMNLTVANDPAVIRGFRMLPCTQTNGMEWVHMRSDYVRRFLPTVCGDDGLSKSVQKSGNTVVTEEEEWTEINLLADAVHSGGVGRNRKLRKS